MPAGRVEMFAYYGDRLPIVRQSAAAPACYAALNISVLCAAGFVLQRLGVIEFFYASPLVAMVAINTHLYGRHAGLITTVIATIAFRALFMPPIQAIQQAFAAEAVIYLSMLALAFMLSPSARARPTCRGWFGVRTASGATIVCDCSGTPVQEIRNI